MAIRIETNRYVASHAKQPKGKGQWAFEFKPYGAGYTADSVEAQIFTPCAMTYREACAFARKWIRDAGYQDMVAHVAP